MDFDLETAKQALDLAGTGAKSVSAIGDMAGRIKGLFQSPKPGADAEVKALLAELTDQIADAKLANADLKEKLVTLLAAMEKTNETKAKLARYELRQTPGGDVVYALRESEAATEPEHFACPKCFEEGVRAILQSSGTNTLAKACRRCSASYRVIARPPTKPRPRGQTWGRF